MHNSFQSLDQHPIAIGSILALITVPVHAVLPFWWSHQLAALVLALIAGIYPGFAAVDGQLKYLIIECLGAAGFIGFAAAAMVYNPPCLPVA